MLKLLIIALIILAAFSLLPALLKSKKKPTPGAIAAKNVLTDREQSMYFRLTNTFPEHIVLCQVAFSALITSKHRPTRNTFDRKIADFVLCDRSFNVLAIIELDDASHQGRQLQDEQRASLLSNAGYRIVRYKQVPNTATLLGDIPPPNHIVPQGVPLS